MKTLIIDDERLARIELRRMLEQKKEVEIVGEAANSEEAIDKIDSLSPDLIMLDIQMPGKNGFELLESLETSPPYVIFTTAFDEFALKAFKYSALDYLLKPIEQDRLNEAIDKAYKFIRSNVEKENEKNKILSAEDRVFVKDGDHCWFVVLGTVRLIESAGNYARMFFSDQKPLILKSLNSLEDRLDPALFFRASRKHIINLQWIDKIEPWFSGGLLVTLKGGEKIEVSRRQAAKFKDMMSI